MKAYTIAAPGCLERGIALVSGAIRVGADPRSGRPVLVPVDPCAEIEPAGARGTAPLFVSAPGRGAVLLIRDHARPGGAWHLRAPWADATWDAFDAEALEAWFADTLGIMRPRAEPPPFVPPTRWYEFARGVEAPADGHAPESCYGYLEEGGAIELVRTGGEDDDAPRVFRVACEGGVVTVRDPRADARGRLPTAPATP